jgi:hypothetical protein
VPALIDASAVYGTNSLGDIDPFGYGCAVPPDPNSGAVVTSGIDPLVERADAG